MAGGGGVGVSQLILFWDTRGSHPKKFVIKRGVFKTCNTGATC